MTVLLPKKLKLTGGTSTFARKFRAGMKALGHQVVLRWQPNYDVLLASPRAPLWVLLDAKLRGKKIVQRLDGVYHPGTTAGRWWRLHNLPLLIIRKYFADNIIYQSTFSQKQCDAYLGQIPHTKSRMTKTIYNGVDTTLFTPAGPSENLRDSPSHPSTPLRQAQGKSLRANHIFITWSRFRRADQIEPLLSAFLYYREQIEASSKLVMIGDISKQLTTISAPGAEMVGPVTNNDLPRYGRAADVFLISHLNPPCPNNVIEAMACGLPIVGTNTGAMPELVTNNGFLVDVNDTKALAEAMHRAWQQRAELGERSRQRAEQQFTLAAMTQRYADVVQL